MTTETIEDKADSIRRQLDQELKRLAADTDLTPQARRDRGQQVRNTAKASMDQLRSGAKADRERAQAAAIARVAGAGAKTGTDAISIRDATERAERLETAKDAERLIDRARQNGDEMLIRAILVEARDRSREPITGAHWGRLLNAEGRAGTQLAADVQAMSIGHGSSFADALRYMLPTASDVDTMLADQ